MQRVFGIKDSAQEDDDTAMSVQSVTLIQATKEIVGKTASDDQPHNPLNKYPLKWEWEEQKPWE